MFKILVVDDEPQIETLFRFNFRKSEQQNLCQILFALSGAQALDVLSKHNDISLMLSDINMPEMDGFQLIEQARKQGHKLPIYIISSYDSKEYIERANSLGVSLFFPKPLNFKMLKDKIISEFNYQLY